MRIKSIFPGLLLAATVLVPTPVFAQQDEDVRGAFMTSRPKATGSASSQKTTTSVKPNRRRPKTTATGSSGATNGVAKAKPSPSPFTPAKLNAGRLGLGLTLFMRDSNGLAVRTDPSHEFRKGDHVRVLIETNADGYLYVFNTTDNGKPVMLYPDPDLDEAGNYFQAHVPFEIPSSGAPEERLRWLTFDKYPGAEKLYFVFTREPLSAVPIEDDLISYCREKEGRCPWSPGAEVWAQIQNEMNEPVKTVKSQNSGGAQTSGEHRAVTRGIGLNRDDPEPSLIMLTGSTNQNLLVVILDLVHKS